MGFMIDLAFALYGHNSHTLFMYAGGETSPSTIVQPGK
jgi:hypothetical protein